MQTWYHGSKSLISHFQDPMRQGVHFGTFAQAKMRNAAFIHEVIIADCPEGRTRDKQGWASAVRRAVANGVGTLRYLNRFEGIPSERIEKLIESGDYHKLDQVSDAAFRKLVPEAEYSIVVTDPTLITIQRVLDRSGELVWETPHKKDLCQEL